MGWAIGSREASRGNTCGEDRPAGGTAWGVACEEVWVGKEDQGIRDEGTRSDERGEYAGAGEETVKRVCLEQYMRGTQPPLVDGTREDGEHTAGLGTPATSCIVLMSSRQPLLLRLRLLPDSLERGSHQGHY
jgi:hypothetical protein